MTSATFVRNEEFVAKKLGEEYVLGRFDGSTVDTDVIYVLNETASLVWEALEQGNTQQGIVDMVCSQYSVDSKDATADVGELLGHLIEIGAVQEAAEVPQDTNEQSPD